MKKKKKVLILGVTGQDGSFMAKLMLDKNYSVFGLVRKSATGNLHNINEILSNRNFNIDLKGWGGIRFLYSFFNSIHYF